MMGRFELRAQLKVSSNNEKRITNGWVLAATAFADEQNINYVFNSTHEATAKCNLMSLLCFIVLVAGSLMQFD
jgi:hypothetical protein